MALPGGWLPHTPVSPQLLFILCVLSVSIVNAQLPPKTAGPDPVDNFCMRWWSQSVVKNDVLYIDSGVQKFNDSGDIYLGINNHILNIPLTNTWDWKTNITIGVTRKNVSNPATGTAVPNLIRGHIFHGPEDTSQIYRYGGTTYMYNQSFESYIKPDTSTYPLWTYEPGSNTPWDQHTLGQPWQPNRGAAAEAIDQGYGFYLGGQIDMGTSTKTLGEPFKDNTQTLYVPLEGMMVINLVDLTAANISVSSMNRSTPRVGGTLDYIDPVGGSGILVALGGHIQPDLELYEVANATKGVLIDFETVDVFDLASYFDDPSSNGTWYQQTTTGDIPPPRIDFCTVAISAPDNSSHHIYLYGGYDPTIPAYYDDVVVLSLPSFTWTTVWSNDQGESPRYGHKCHRAGKRQMITIGGNVSNVECDWEYKGVALLDLTTIEWGSVFHGDSEDFKVPRNVLRATNGTADGEATIREPRQGWTEDGLGQVFRTPRRRVPMPPNGTNSTQGPDNPNKPEKTSVGAIAGGVVGGIAGLMLIAGGLFLLRRRRKRSSVETNDDEAPSNNANEKAPSHNDDEKAYIPELQAMSAEPAELPGPDPQELHAPRQAVEADHGSAVRAAELSATNVVAGGLHGVPIVRTPGDDLPERPAQTHGLRRPSRDNHG